MKRRKDKRKAPTDPAPAAAPPSSPLMRWRSGPRGAPTLTTPSPKPAQPKPPSRFQIIPTVKGPAYLDTKTGNVRLPGQLRDHLLQEVRSKPPQQNPRRAGRRKAVDSATVEAERERRLAVGEKATHDALAKHFGTSTDTIARRLKKKTPQN
jgi:hypothetical protein